MAAPHCTGSLWLLQLPHSPSFSPTSLVLGCSLSLVFLLFTSRQDQQISFLIPFRFADILQIKDFMTTGRDDSRHCCRVFSLFTLFISMFSHFDTFIMQCVQLALYTRTRVIMQECHIDAQQRAHRNSVYTVWRNLKKMSILCLVDRQVTLVPLRPRSVFTSLSWFTESWAIIFFLHHQSNTFVHLTRS
jgi:hypothetical protein